MLSSKLVDFNWILSVGFEWCGEERLIFIEYTIPKRVSERPKLGDDEGSI